MNIYEVIDIEKEIDLIALENNGEIPEKKLKELVEAQANSIESIEKMCRYIRHLEQFVKTAKEEKERINNLQRKAELRMENIKKFMTPFVKNKGKFNSGTFSLGTIKSYRLSSDTKLKRFPEYEKTEVLIKTDWSQLRKDLMNGKKVSGAELEENDNLQIK